MNRWKKIGEMFDLDASGVILLAVLRCKTRRISKEELFNSQPPFCISSHVVGPSNLDDKAARFTLSDDLLGAHMETSGSPRCSSNVSGTIRTIM